MGVRMVMESARIAEYVVVHEMVHLHEPHHTPEFWLRLERAMPDYAQRKEWLAGWLAGWLSMGLRWRGFNKDIGNS